MFSDQIDATGREIELPLGCEMFLETISYKCVVHKV